MKPSFFITEMLGMFLYFPAHSKDDKELKYRLIPMDLQKKLHRDPLYQSDFKKTAAAEWNKPTLNILSATCLSYLNAKQAQFFLFDDASSC